MKEEFTSRKVLAFLIIIMASPFLFVFFWIILPSFFDDRTSSEIYLEFKIKESFHGKIDSIYRQENNHNILALKSGDSIFQVPSFWEDRFQLNDSIAKDRNSLFVNHYRNDTLIAILDYKEEVKDWK